MKCGEFPAKARNKISIQARTDVLDDYGGSTVTWAEVYNSWAVIEPMGGREAFLSQQLQSRITHSMTIRYLAALKDTATAAKYRVLFDGRIFSVKFIKNIDSSMKMEGKVFQVLTCEENDAEN